jgi:hypothetical protein
MLACLQERCKDFLEMVRLLFALLEAREQRDPLPGPISLYQSVQAIREAPRSTCRNWA